MHVLASSLPGPYRLFHEASDVDAAGWEDGHCPGKLFQVLLRSSIALNITWIICIIHANYPSYVERDRRSQTLRHNFKILEDLI